MAYEDLDEKMLKIIKKKVEDAVDENDSILISPGSMQEALHRELGSPPSMPTLRRWGFGKERKFDKMYDCMTWNNLGDKNMHGLVVKTSEFLEVYEDPKLAERMEAMES